MRTTGSRTREAEAGAMPAGEPAPGARELPDAALDLVIGGAGDLTAEMMARLVADGVVPPGRGSRRDG